MKVWPVILVQWCFIALMAPVHGEPGATESQQDPIGHRRLTEAYVYLMNAVSVAKGGPITSRPKLEKAAARLGNREMRREIGAMADIVEKTFSQIPTEAQELAVTTRIRAARIALTSRRDIKLEDIHKLEIERRKKPKHDSPASFLRHNVEAIHEALAAR